MKVEHIASGIEPSPIFPVIMQSVDSGAIVLFSSLKEGVLLKKGNKAGFDVTGKVEEWAECDAWPWKPLKGKLELSN